MKRPIEVKLRLTTGEYRKLQALLPQILNLDPHKWIEQKAREWDREELIRAIDSLANTLDAPNLEELFRHEIAEYKAGKLEEATQ